MFREGALRINEGALRINEGALRINATGGRAWKLLLVVVVCLLCPERVACLAQECICCQPCMQLCIYIVVDWLGLVREQ